MYIVRREVVIWFVLISSVVVVYIFTSLFDMSVSGKCVLHTFHLLVIYIRAYMYFTQYEKGYQQA